jgi:hypothetical protein
LYKQSIAALFDVGQLTRLFDARNVHAHAALGPKHSPITRSSIPRLTLLRI